MIFRDSRTLKNIRRETPFSRAIQFTKKKSWKSFNILFSFTFPGTLFPVTHTHAKRPHVMLRYAIANRFNNMRFFRYQTETRDEDKGQNPQFCTLA